MYPNGNKEEKGDNHISLYLIICDTESLEKGWKVHVDVKFFVYDHIAHNYVIFQGKVLFPLCYQGKIPKKSQILHMKFAKNLTFFLVGKNHKFSSFTHEVGEKPNFFFWLVKTTSFQMNGFLKTYGFY